MRKLFVIGDVILEKDFFCIVMPQIQSVGAYIFLHIRPSVSVYIVCAQLLLH